VRLGVLVSRVPLLRTLRWLCLAVAALALAVLVTAGFSGRTVLAIGSWRITAHDPLRPLALAAGALGLYGLLDARATRQRWWRRASVAFVGLAAAVVLGVALRDAPRGVALADGAIAELYVLFALKGSWALGPYSQYFWHHPGPVVFYALAPLYALAQQHPAALGVGALVINVVAVGAATRVLVRTLPGIAAVAVTVPMALWICRTGGLLTSYWNPHLILLPTLLFFWLAVGVGIGRLSLLPLLVGVGSALVQTHIGTSPTVGAIVALAVWLAWRLPMAVDSPGSPHRWRRALNTSAWVGVALWFLPLAEQFANRGDGNVAKLVTYFAERHGAVHGVGYVVNSWAVAVSGAVLPEFRQPTGWTVSGESSLLATLATLSQLAGLAMVAFHGQLRDTLSRAAAMAAVAVVLTLVSVFRIPGEVHDHSIFWMGVVGGTGWGIVLAGCVSKLYPTSVHWPGADRAGRLLPVVMTGMTLALGVFWIATGLQQRPQVGAAAEALDLYKRLPSMLDERHAVKPLVRIDEAVWVQASGTLLLLYKSGRPFSVERRWLHMYGAPLAVQACDFSHVLRFLPAGSSSEGELLARSGGVETRLEPASCVPIAP
jgi:hypothetical protein